MTTEAAQMKLFREKAQAGTLTAQDIREAVTLLRAGRVSACFASAGAKVKVAKKTAKSKKVVVPDANAFSLGELTEAKIKEIETFDDPGLDMRDEEDKKATDDDAPF